MARRVYARRSGSLTWVTPVQIQPQPLTTPHLCCFTNMAMFDVQAFLIADAEKEKSPSLAHSDNESVCGNDGSSPSSPAPAQASLGPPFTQANVRYTQDDNSLTMSPSDGSSSGSSDASVSSYGGRKRAGESLDIFVQRVAQRLKLKPENAMALSKFTKVSVLTVTQRLLIYFEQLSSFEREVTLMATVLHSQEIIQKVQPANAAWTLPRSLHVSISLCSTCAGLSLFSLGKNRAPFG